VICSPVVEIAGCGIRAANTHQIVAAGTELRLYNSQHLAPDGTGHKMVSLLGRELGKLGKR
jgi:hypothetical protein